VSAHKAPASAIPSLAPQTLSLRFCTACGRTDRNGDLPLPHWHGGLCRGEIVVAVYRFDRIQGGEA
jgi:hypothetical protein